MAKVKLNPVLEGFHGAVGDLVFRKYGEEVIVGRKPDPTGKAPTPGQLAVREQFRLAAVYGKAVLADPVSKALYTTEAKAKGIPAFALALADFFNEPTVDEVDLSAYAGAVGDVIRIRAHDDVAITGVAVSIRAVDGTVLEQGPASSGNDGVFQYTATRALTPGQQVSIEVTATDRPGHHTLKTAAMP
jgi:hypothetical protein